MQTALMISIAHQNQEEFRSAAASARRTPARRTAVAQHSASSASPTRGRRIRRLLRVPTRLATV